MAKLVEGEIDIITSEIIEPKLRIALLDALDDPHILPQHLKGLRRLTFSPVEGEKWKDENGKPRTLMGVYIADDFNGVPVRALHLNPHHLKTLKDTLVHEIGHHLQRHGFRMFDKETDNALDAMTELLAFFIPIAYNTPSKLHAYGLRQYSFIDQSEFIADVFRVYVLGKLSALDKLDKKFRELSALKVGDEWSLQRLFELAGKD